MIEYLRSLQEASKAWASGAAETDLWARAALVVLINGQHTPMSLAQSVYDCLKPVNARGERVNPKVLRGRLTVRSLENTSAPVPGAAAARKNLETVLLVCALRDEMSLEINRFIRGDSKIKLYGLLANAKAQ